MEKPTIPEVLALAKEYYSIPGNEVGGHLHIVLEDRNIKDSDVKHCLESAIECNDTIGITLAEKLLQMSWTQRKKLYRLRRTA